jgi:hypothetical protein
MTPLIREMVAHSPEPTSFMWFDAGKLDWTDHVRVPVDIIMNLPFRRTAICAVDRHGTKLAMCLIGGQDSVTVAGYNINPFNLFKPFVYMNTPEGLKYFMKDKELTWDVIKPAFRMVVAGLLRIHEQSTGYQPVAAKSFINKKRAAKGKPPLTFDWHTVTIEPPAPKSDPQGGTHASPRLHDRRGHWRKMKSGKTVWVRECKVGDASKGVVFKDYVIEGATSDGA